MKNINCVIIDDEELARKLLEAYVDKVDYLNFKGAFENPFEALTFLKLNQVDLVFLDIQMPEIKGTDLAELLLKSDVKIIFTTAYSEYAIEGFELSALDYLLKPITFKRFLSALEKFPEVERQYSQHIIIKSGYDLHKVAPEDILYIESDSEYVRYHLESGKKIMANQSLSKLISKLPTSFLQVHRSFIINGDKVSGLKGRELILGQFKIPVSDSYFENVKKRLFG